MGCPWLARKYTSRGAGEGSSSPYIDPHVLQRLPGSCPCLSELGVAHAAVDQAGLDVLLAHMHLTGLRFATITPAEIGQPRNNLEHIKI